MVPIELSQYRLDKQHRERLNEISSFPTQTQNAIKRLWRVTDIRPEQMPSTTIARFLGGSPDLVSAIMHIYRKYGYEDRVKVGGYSLVAKTNTDIVTKPSRSRQSINIQNWGDFMIITKYSQGFASDQYGGMPLYKVVLPTDVKYDKDQKELLSIMCAKDFQTPGEPVYNHSDEYWQKSFLVNPDLITLTQEAFNALIQLVYKPRTVLERQVQLSRMAHAAFAERQTPIPFTSQ